jgi:hypothetical protein
MDARADVDGMTQATAHASGRRDGQDAEWSGDVAGPSVKASEFEFTLVDGAAHLRSDGADSQPVVPPTAGALDERLAGALRAPGTAPIEDLGIDLLGGIAARHCRTAVDGPRAIGAFLPLAWLLGRQPLDDGPALEIWRGQLDWWTVGEGHVARADVVIGGHPADAWASSGLRGTLRAHMEVFDDDATPPAPTEGASPVTSP